MSSYRAFLLENPDVSSSLGTKEKSILYPLIEDSGCDLLGKAHFLESAWDIYSKKGPPSPYAENTSSQRLFCVENTMLLSFTLIQKNNVSVPEGVVFREISEILECYNNAWYDLGMDKSGRELRQPQGGVRDILLGAGIGSASISLALQTPYSSLALGALLLAGGSSVIVGAVREQRKLLAKKSLRELTKTTVSDDRTRQYGGFSVGERALGILLTEYFNNNTTNRRQKDPWPNIPSMGEQIRQACEMFGNVQPVSDDEEWPIN